MFNIFLIDLIQFMILLLNLHNFLHKNDEDTYFN